MHSFTGAGNFDNPFSSIQWLQAFRERQLTKMKRELSRRMRLIILLAGVILILCALTALLYSFRPLDDASLQEMLSATLFAPP